MSRLIEWVLGGAVLAMAALFLGIALWDGMRAGHLSTLR